MIEDVQTLENVVQNLIAHYGWIVIILFVSMFFKDMVHGWIVGISVFVGNDINNDDIIYVSGRQARVVRVGMKKTIFYMTDRGTKMIIPNDRLKALVIEKRLPQNGDKDYLPKKYEYDIRDGYTKNKEKNKKK